MNKSIAYLKWSLDIKCPKCQKDNDLSGSPHDDDGTHSIAIFNNNWEDLEGEVVYCEHCEHEFEIEKAEY